jgi:hypothetical protein
MEVSKHACKVAKTFDIWSEIASKRRAEGVLTPASDCACQSRSSSQQPAQTAARQQPSVRPFAAHPPPTRCTAPHLTANTLTVASTPPLRPSLFALAADLAIRAHCLGEYCPSEA